MILRKHFVTILLTCMVMLSAKSIASSNSTDFVPKRNLFVGNSFSFYNNGIHNHYSNLIRASGKWQRGQNYNRLSTLSGGSLLEHEADMLSILNAAKKSYDAVILQGHSMESIDPKRILGFRQGVKTLAKIAIEHKATPVLFMTWGYKDDIQMSQKVARAHLDIGQQLAIEVVPVGLAFTKVASEYPEIALFIPDVLGADVRGKLSYRKDWKHPSVAGTYLAACVFYAALEQKSPEGSVYQASLDTKTALKLQQVAWQVVQEFIRK